MEVTRPYWNKIINETFKKMPIVWLAGVRRAGKTTLIKSFKEANYFNCDLPSVQEDIRNPEQFYKAHKSKFYIFDEIHQLEEASILLKIGADTLPGAKFIVTGSSTLIASKKFKDTLTGRKRDVHFLPILTQEIESFNSTLKKRLLHGGLPPALLSEELDREFYSEWLDSFYARDIQELFSIEKRQPFLKTLEYLIIANGGMLDVTKLSQASGISRPTAIKYLDALEVTKAISTIKPYSQNAEQEIVSQSKVYAFDTGFYCYVNNIRELRNEDCGLLLENLVLENFQAYGYGKYIRYWRTKQKHEIDFVLPIERNKILAIECKWKEKNFDDSNLKIFRKKYPEGENWIITSDSKTRSEKEKNLNYHFINIMDLHKVIENLSL